jgi:uncharacterized protein YdaU (DUF1376 family)
MAGKPPWFAFFPKDFAGDELVEAMSTLEVGAYILLLCKAWSSEPPGSLPDDDAVLARYARLDPGVWSEVKPRVLAPFSLGADKRWHQKRMREEYASAVHRMKAFSRRGRQAAEARWKRPPDATSMHDACNEHASCIPQAMHDACLVGVSISSSLSSEAGSIPGGGAGGGGTDATSMQQASVGKRKPPKGKDASEDAARRVVDHYQRAVSPQHTRDRGVKNVGALFKKGLTEAQLCACADGYAADCSRKGTEPKFRKAVGNFYGQDATYEDYLHGNAAPAVGGGETPEQRAKRLREQAERNAAAARESEECRKSYVPLRKKSQAAKIAEELRIDNDERPAREAERQRPAASEGTAPGGDGGADGGAEDAAPF